ncbi:MAG: pyridoxamine 5'-phosphate oxidase [Proteobacteria bacterium]|nr:pyridoxamine 5'-phosphate oxidase [Pseudomonadota bacterium]MDA0993113.1 pyridoxamine 5'-phosphate oxidase [Pseudomonadota bacterium]
MTDNWKKAGLPTELPDDPMHWADAWLTEALAGNAQRNPNAMTIATVDAAGQPSARVVLCKQFVPDPGYLVFYTNYQSRKGRELGVNPRAAGLFHWDAVGRQIRIEGIVVRSPVDESDTYFASRDWGSQLGAWGSDQSEPVESKEALVSQIRKRGSELGLILKRGTQDLSAGSISHVNRPPQWGGFRLWATDVELWLEGADRVHDRAKWTREINRVSEDRFSTTRWTSTRLQP